MVLRSSSYTDIKYQNGERSTRKYTAVFGEVTVNLNDHWKLLAGARWYDSSVDRDYFDRVPATHPDPVEVVGESDEDGWLPKIGFQYVFDDARMVYALYSEGFRLGGVNRHRAEQRASNRPSRASTNPTFCKTTRRA